MTYSRRIKRAHYGRRRPLRAVAMRTLPDSAGVLRSAAECCEALREKLRTNRDMLDFIVWGDADTRYPRVVLTVLKSQISRLEQIQKSVARAVVKSSKP